MTSTSELPMSGKTVLITGATSGIGKATAFGLAAMGAQLAIAGRDPDRTQAVANEIRSAHGGTVDFFVADLRAGPGASARAGSSPSNCLRSTYSSTTPAAAGTPATSPQTGWNEPSP